MHVCGQTLVLVDNDITVSEINRKIVKATLKYMFYHRPEDRAFCLRAYEHDITGAEEYLTDESDLVCDADIMEFEEKDINLSDTLAEVITRWRDSDFACRDILVFTDGLEDPAVNHEREELNYLLETGGYPVYVVFLNQEDNAGAKKGLLSIAVPSGGKLFETELPDSEAGIDRLLTEKIYGAMDAYAAANWKKYEETDDAGADTINEDRKSEEAGEGADTNDAEGENAAEGKESDRISEDAVVSPDYMADTVPEERVVYEYTPPEEAGGIPLLLVSAALIAAGLILAVFASFVIMKKRRAEKRVTKPVMPDEDEYFEDYELKGMGTVDLTGVDEGDTVFLGDDEAERNSATRILADTRFVNLTDKENRKRIFRIMLGAPMIIGRGKCDVVIQGDDALSKRHCEIFEKNGEAYVRDLASANGTKINNVRINEESLSDGDELTIGSRTYMVAIV